MKNTSSLKKAKASNKPGAVFIQNGILAAVISLAFLTILLAVLALVISRISIAFSTHQTMTILAAAVSALLGAYIAARRRKSNGFLLGLLTGVIVFVALTGLMLAFGDRSFSVQTVIKLAILLCAGSIGGIWGVAKANTVKKVKVKI